ncbi:hypothetical protein SRHO_G00343440 [Serrasalmus rhombeus]
MLKLCSEVEFFRSTLNGATPGTRSLRPGEPGKLRKMCPERDASALSGFIPPWERQRFNTHSFRQQNSELCAGAALRGTTRTAGTCLRLLSNGGGGGAHCDRSCGNGISLKHKTWSLSPSVQSVSVMKATLLVLLLSAVAVMLSCDHQHSEREAGPGCPLGKRLAFDVNTTIEESKRLNNEYFDCPNPEPGAPCFYYSHDLDVSLAEIEEEFYKEALRHASSDGKHSKRKIELTKRYLQLLAAMDQHAQKYRSQACLLDKLVETFFMDQDEETRSDAVE